VSASTTPEKPIQKAEVAAQKATKAATTSAPRRRYRTVAFQGALIAVASAFALLTLLAKTTPFFPIDLQITRGIQEINNPGFAQFMAAISWPGFPPQSFVIPLLIAALLYALGLHWEAVAAVIVAVSASAIDVLAKDLVRRPRPTSSLVHVLRILNDYSFPSGHVVFYVAFFGFLFFLAFVLLKESLKRNLLLILFGVLILFVGASRIYAGEHWASDVAGAYLLGSLILVANIAFYRWGKSRFFVARAQPVDSSEKPDPQRAKRKDAGAR
jgi:membrane-associated phospholipid phosphatase